MPKIPRYKFLIPFKMARDKTKKVMMRNYLKNAMVIKYPGNTHGLYLLLPH